MTDFRNSFMDGFPIDEIGVFTGTQTYRPFPSRAGELFRLKSQSTNIGSFFIGTTTGSHFGMGIGAQIAFELDSGDDTGWFKLMGNDLSNLFYYNPSGSSEKLAYWIQR